MKIQLSISTTANVFLADWSTRVKSCHVRTGVHGFESCEAELELPFLEVFLYYQQLGPLKLKVSWGNFRVWEGRLEDPTQFAETKSGLKIVAFGAWVALSDAPYTALWSTATVSGWRPVLVTENAGMSPDRYIFDTQNRLFISPIKNAAIGASTDVGALTDETPDGGSRTIVGCSFDYDLLLPVNWNAQLVTQLRDFTSRAQVWILAATGALQRGSINITFTGRDRLEFNIFNTAGVAAHPNENGANYLKITNLRLVTSTTNRINTTLGTNIAAGTRIVTPGSMARIYVGQRLFISQGSVTVGESVVVTAITSTTFTAVFAFAHITTDTVHVHVIYPDEVMKDCVSTISTLNTTQLSSDQVLIQSQAVDLDQAVYEDQLPSEIIAQLIAKSDNQTTPRQWAAMVYNDQKLIVRPRGSGSAWYTDVTSLEIVRTLTQLYNSVYAVYKDTANKRSLRTVVSANSDSVLKFGITRRKAVVVDTTDSTQATRVRDSVLALQIDPVPRASVMLDRIFDKYGNPHPLFFIRADDTLTIRNLPPILAAVLYDKIRTLVITRTDVDMIQDSINLELEIPLPDVAVQLAQALKGNV